jgi:pimeloyl-ACP methyl ester carboxylesterase
MDVAHVFVPGLGLDERSSADLRELVPAEVICLPGMGLAAPVPSIDVLAARLLDALVDGPIVLTGHSQSCQVVAAAAALDPRVVALVLLGPTTDPRLRSGLGLVRQWLRTAVHEPVRAVPVVLAQWWRTGPRSMLALWRTAAPDPIERRLAEVRVPVVVLRGTRDRLCPHDWATRVAAAAPRGRLVEIPDAAHMTPQTHPDDVAPILVAVARR